MFPCEDAHTQERALMGPVLALTQVGELWIADRNFCTRANLTGWHARKSTFLEREHAVNARPEEVDALRRIEIELDTPTEDGDTILRLLTNAPPSLGAQEIAALHLRRWRIECMFQRLKSVLQSEIRSLGHPRAALLAFGVAALAYNMLTGLQTAISLQPASKLARDDVSPYYLAVEIRAHYAGMLTALAPGFWQV